MGIVRRGLLASAVAGLLVSSVASFAAQVNTEPPSSDLTDAPPTARTVDVVDHAFGLALPDPYRWMEGQNNAEFDAWLKAQGAFTRAKLDALPTLAVWRERLQDASKASVFFGGFQRVGGKVFYLRYSGKSTGTLMVRDADGRQRVLLDPASPNGGNGQSPIQSFTPSPDGRLVAIDIGLGAGMEISRIRLLNTHTLQWLPDVVGPVWGEFAASWLPDGSGFAYTQMAPENERVGGDPVQGMRARLHVLGTPVADDPILLRAGDGEGASAAFRLAANEFPLLFFDNGSDWAIAGAGGARLEARLCVAPVTAAIKAGAHWRCLAEYADDVHGAGEDGVGIGFQGDTLYLLSVHAHPNGQVLAIDLSDPNAGLQDARVAVPTDDSAVITSIVTARDALYVKRMRDGIDELLRVDYASGEGTPIALPIAGSLSVAGDPRADGIVLDVRGWTNPPVAYSWDAKHGLQEMGIRAISPGDYGMLTSVETEAISKDGTRVPLSIIHRKDIRPDGRHRALVNGYGSYGLSSQPNFNPYVLEWAKAGDVYAVCHVRGGGEKGDAWHRAGQGANKHKSVEDVIGCAEELSRLGYTTPARTALSGASAGGLLVGGAVTTYPDKFGAAVIGVGMLNPVRLLAAENGANQIGELGDPGTAEGLKAIAAMDPYQQIKAGREYPAVLFQVGLKDGRVSPWNTGKFAARLLAANIGDRPIWIRTDDEVGHFAFSLDGAAAQRADQYAFLDAELPID